MAPPAASQSSCAPRQGPGLPPPPRRPPGAHACRQCKFHMCCNPCNAGLSSLSLHGDGVTAKSKGKTSWALALSDDIIAAHDENMTFLVSPGRAPTRNSNDDVQPIRAEPSPERCRSAWRSGNCRPVPRRGAPAWASPCPPTLTSVRPPCSPEPAPGLFMGRQILALTIHGSSSLCHALWRPPLGVQDSVPPIQR